MIITIPESKRGMEMSNDEIQVRNTQHAFLVAWGWFAEHVGLVQALEDVPLRQKKYTHTPQTKVQEFLVAILAGWSICRTLAYRHIRWIWIKPWQKPGGKQVGLTTLA
jgi:hypothetical protein